MPNWCENSVTITGDKQSLDSLWAVIRPDDPSSEPADLSKAYPCPEPLRDTVSGSFPEDHPEYAAWKAQQAANIATYGFTDWYDWCVANWGTKWAPKFDFDLSDDSKIVLWGDTAWSPPLELLGHISEKFPTLTFTITFSEGGMDFVGAAIIKNGEVNESSGNISSHVREYDPGDDGDDDAWFDEVREETQRLMDAHLVIAKAHYEVGL